MYCASLPGHIAKPNHDLNARSKGVAASPLPCRSHMTVLFAIYTSAWLALCSRMAWQFKSNHSFVAVSAAVLVLRLAAACQELSPCRNVFSAVARGAKAARLAQTLGLQTHGFGRPSAGQGCGGPGESYSIVLPCNVALR